MSELVPVEEQTGPPPLVEELCDTNDLPEGFVLPDQSPVSQADLEEVSGGSS